MSEVGEIIKLGEERFFVRYEHRRWISLFGVNPQLTNDLRNRLKCEPIHLLWALNYLKVYPTIDNGSSWAGVSQKTYVDKINFIFDLMNIHLPTVNSLFHYYLYKNLIISRQMKFSRRFQNWEYMVPSFMVDGTDVPIKEPKKTRWNEKIKFYSQKLGGPAIRYVIGAHVESGEIIWASSAYPAGTYEPKIVEKEIAVLLHDNERILADRLYTNNPLFVTPLAYDCQITRSYCSIRSKIERVMHELKVFDILKNEYRSFNYDEHEFKFHLICRLVNFKKNFN